MSDPPRNQVLLGPVSTTSYSLRFVAGGRYWMASRSRQGGRAAGAPCAPAAAAFAPGTPAVTPAAPGTPAGHATASTAAAAANAAPAARRASRSRRPPGGERKLLQGTLVSEWPRLPRARPERRGENPSR